MPKHQKSSLKLGDQIQPSLRHRSVVRFQVLAGVAFIVVVTSIAYLPSWHGGFILDDDGLLTKNTLVHAPDGLHSIWFTTQTQDYWPLTYTTFWLEWRLWGDDPTGYHLVNLALHVAAALLIWTILYRLSVPGAFLAAVLFALHPVNVESVAWISQRKNTLALLFFLLSILWYLNYDRTLTRRSAETTNASAQSNLPDPPRKAGWYWLSLCAFALALLSKGSVVVLPPILLGLIWWRRKIEKADLTRMAPFFVLAVAFTAVNIWFQSLATPGVIRAANFTERLLGAGAVVWFYLYKALWPLNLAFVYPAWHIQPNRWWWWLPLSAAIGVTALLWWQRNTAWGRSLLLAWGFFCVALVPVMGFTDVGYMRFSLVADHYQHIAIIGVLALVAAAWSDWRQHSVGSLHHAATAAAVVVVGTLTYLTWQQSGLYQNARTAYEAALEKNPDSWMLHGNLGGTLADEGEAAAAIEQLDEALRLNPASYDAEFNLGRTLIKLHRLPEALEHLQDAVRLKPDYYAAYYQLVMLYAQTDRPDEALATAEKALEIARSKGADLLVAEIQSWEQSFKSQHPPRSLIFPEPNTIIIQH
jgi:tetratricopeptide (TPR) repeat protein